MKPAAASARPSVLVIRNPQRDCPVEVRLLRRITLAALAALAPGRPYELCVHLVSAPRMARVNWQFLQHEGPTDVITFDLADGAGGPLAGEIFVSPAVAVLQAREFGTTWQAETVRYVAHGILHLLGFDDLQPAKRRVMKQAENRIVRQLQQQFSLGQLAAASARAS